MFVLTLTDDKLLKFVLIWGKSCVVFVWGEKLGWPRTLFSILLGPNRRLRAPCYSFQSLHHHDMGLVVDMEFKKHLV